MKTPIGSIVLAACCASAAAFAPAATPRGLAPFATRRAMFSGAGEAAPTDAREFIERLRQEPFNEETEKKLKAHPYIKDAEDGNLSRAQLRAFALEQYAIQLSDATSFAFLAGHKAFTPSSLVGIDAPEPISEKSPPDLFQFLLGGEIFAAPLLLEFAKQLGLDEEALRSHNSSALAQAYPSFWARLALSGKRAAGAAACAVNFPAWGQMCKRLHEALGKSDAIGIDGEGLAFIGFFGTPIENLDDMAAAVIEEEGISYEELVEPVRLLQAYEVMFWDACYKAK